ncbi:hypothetical protein N7523_000683 [Penicillium sp. IBT 18751x]|nr:hypothetical protein N7523_000683 [Penicillium sp. IBT 18751x]
MSTNTKGNLGWVAEPDGRGTWAILSTCSLTILLCCWSSVYPNIPSRSDGVFKRGLGKINLFLIGLLGPEFLLVIALGQWSSARTSSKVCIIVPKIFKDANLINRVEIPSCWLRELDYDPCILR